MSSDQFRALITSPFIAQAVHAAAEIGLADALDEPAAAETLARACAVRVAPLRRVLRLLVAVDLLARLPDGRYALTELGRRLRTDAPGSMRHATLLFCAEPYRAAAELSHALRTGELAFERVYGMGHFDYLDANASPRAVFHRAIAELTGVAVAELVDTIELRGSETIIDVGGGEGRLVLALLATHPETRGVIFELDAAIELARAAVDASGLSSRCAVVGGDFFTELPRDGDLYLLKSVIHDWDDARAIALLERCRAAMRSDARLLLVERVITDEQPSIHALVNDLIMLTVTGGAERDESEYRELLRASGFMLETLVPTGSGFAVLEARPA